MVVVVTPAIGLLHSTGVIHAERALRGASTLNVASRCIPGRTSGSARKGSLRMCRTDERECDE